MANGIDYGMTPEGFIPKRLASILDDLNNSVSGIVHPDSGEFPFQNVSDDSILQQIFGVFAEALSECWEAAYDGAVQFDPLKNSGAGQAGTVQLNAMLMKAGTYTQVRMRLSGREGTFIPEGSRIAGVDGELTFVTRESASIPASGSTEALAVCTEKGPFDPEQNSIIKIQTPVGGWLSAQNVETLSVGSYQETEEELRRRQQRSTSLTSYRHIEAIYAAVMNVSGVTYCRAYQNDSVYPQDERGIPFKEVAVVAEGGDATEVGRALFLRFPVGVVGFGNTAAIFYDTQGTSYTISFSRPQDVPVRVEMDITVTNRAEFPDDAADRIKEAILNYAAYGGEGNEDGFPPGANVVCSRLYTPANSVPGHKITRLVIGKEGAGALSEADIVIAWDEVARFIEENMAINVVSV